MATLGMAIALDAAFWVTSLAAREVLFLVTLRRKVPIPSPHNRVSGRVPTSYNVDHRRM